MRRNILYIITFIFLLSGCSNEIGTEEDLHQTNEVPVPIQIMPKRIDATTKATIEIFTNDNVKEIGIYGKNNTDIIYNGISPSQIGTSQQLIFTDPSLVYPVDGSSITLTGYFPRQSKSTVYSINNNTLNFTLTGEEDLMYATPTDAGNKKAPKPVDLNFAHKLTNVKFKLINGTENTLPDGNISITTNAFAKGSMNLSDGTITKDESSTLPFTLSTNINANTMESQNAITVNGGLLLFPAQDYTFKLKIGEQSYNIQIDTANKPAWKEGISYLLTITIKSLNKTQTVSTTKSFTPNEPLPGAFAEGYITQIEE